MYGNPEHRPTEQQKIEKIAYDRSNFTQEHIAAIQRFRQHTAVNPTRSDSWAMDKNHIFPNTHIDVGPKGFWTHQFWPISVGETRHEARFWLRKASTIRQRFSQEYNIAHAVDIILEDLSNVERTQLGINSRGTDTMQLSDSEVLIRRSLDNVERWATAKTVADAMGGEVA
jgi:hypothetical protein